MLKTTLLRFLKLDQPARPSRRVLTATGLIVALLTAATAPSAMSHAYAGTIVQGGSVLLAACKALSLLIAVAVLWLVHAVLYLYVVYALLLPLLRDLRSACSALAAGIRRIPDGLSAASAWCGTARRAVGRNVAAAAAAAGRWPGRWRAMSRGDKAAAVFAGVTVVLFFALGYLNWSLSAGLHNRLPQWLRVGSDWMGTLYIDVIITALMWAFIMPLWTLLARLVVRTLKSGRRSD